MKYLAIIFMLQLFGASAYGGDTEWLSLNGKIRVATEPLSDPVPAGKPVAYLLLQGAGAKAMYDRLQGFKTTTDACGESGLVSRSVGDVVCYRKKSSYSCEFGVRLSDGVTRVGRTC